ncbi:MAG: LysE family translocator [Rhizobiaceae bacterium]|nr:LysE family translocator [Rhizobiaceae bacterium]
MSFESWLVFMAIWIAASLPLGPNALNCISVSATHGFQKGLWSVAGVFIAAIIHMTLAVSGIAAFLNSNPVLFEILRWLGVGYLAWMGVSMLRSKGKFKVEKSLEEFSRWQSVRRAVLISMGNPKSIFVWLAVFTQFINAGTPLAPQLLVLAPSALFITVVVYIGYCAIGLGVNRLFSGKRKMWFDRITGTTYLAFAFGLGSADLRRA